MPGLLPAPLDPPLRVDAGCQAAFRRTIQGARHAAAAAVAAAATACLPAHRPACPPCGGGGGGGGSACPPARLPASRLGGVHPSRWRVVCVSALDGLRANGGYYSVGVLSGSPWGGWGCHLALGASPIVAQHTLQQHATDVTVMPPLPLWPRQAWCGNGNDCTLLAHVVVVHTALHRMCMCAPAPLSPPSSSSSWSSSSPSSSTAAILAQGCLRAALMSILVPSVCAGAALLGLRSPPCPSSGRGWPGPGMSLPPARAVLLLAPVQGCHMPEKISMAPAQE